MSNIDIDTVEVGSVFTDDFGRQWLKLGEGRVVRYLDDDDLEQLKSDIETH